MLEDPSGGRKEGQRTALQRSNRVFILEYSPERSKSKRQKQREGGEPQKERLSSFLSRREMLSESETGEQLSHRSNLDRLALLISRAKSSREDGEGESGCEKLVKAVQKIIKAKKYLAIALEALKKYTMLCSSSNYELFIQSKHHFPLKDRKTAEPALSPIDSINEHHSIEESHNSYQSSQLSPLRNPFHADLTFRKRADEALLQASILRGLQSPRKALQSSKLSGECIPTSETLRSYPRLPFAQQPVLLPRLRSALSSLAALNEAPLVVSGSKQVEFLHLCHLQPHQKTMNQPDEQDHFQEIDQLLTLAVRTAMQDRPGPLAGGFSRGRLDFALPTQNAPSPAHRSKISINYVSEGAQTDSFKRNKRNQPVLNAKEIAERMLFGRETPAGPAIAAEKLVGEARGRKRVSSLPKITFTYSSREKDMILKSPSARCIPPPAEPLKAVLKAGSPRRKEELHSTFGSTQIAVNSTNSRSSRLQSPQQIEAPSRGVRMGREPAGYNPFAGRPLAPAPQATRADSEYYGGFGHAAKQTVPQEQLRPRMATQQAFASRNEIEYVGIEEEPRGCCWAKATRSRSLNERALVGLSQRSPS